MNNIKKNKNSAPYIKESIFFALLELMKEKQFSEIRIQDIAKKAGVSRISYYRNFKSKEDVLNSYMNEETEKFHNEHKGESGNELLIHLLDHLKNYQDQFEVLYKNNLSHLLYEHIYDRCGPKKETEDHTAYLKAAKAAAIFGFIDEWIKRGMKGNTEDVAKELMRCLESASFHFIKIIGRSD